MVLWSNDEKNMRKYVHFYFRVSWRTREIKIRAPKFEQNVSFKQKVRTKFKILDKNSHEIASLKNIALQ